MKKRSNYKSDFVGKQPSEQPYHIILAGSADVGKTSVFQFLSGQTCGNEFDLDARHEPVLLQPSLTKKGSALERGCWCHSLKLSSDISVEVILWDTCNMERGSSKISQVTRSYFRQAVGVVLLYDACRRDTLWDLVAWVKSCRNNSVWESCDKYVTFVLWSNERNYGNSNVSPEDVEQFKKECVLDAEHFTICTTSGENITNHYCYLISSMHHKLSTATRTGKVQPSLSLNPTEEEQFTCC